MHSDPATDSALLDFLRHGREYAVILLDAQARVVQWLGAAQELLGYAADEIVGAGAAAIFTSEDRHQGLDELELAIARERGRSEDDRWHVRKDGTRIWVTGSVHALRDAGGAVTGYVKLLRDRTDLRMHVEKLESRLAACEAAAARTRAFLRTLGATRWPRCRTRRPSSRGRTTTRAPGRRWRSCVARSRCSPGWPAT